MRRRAAVSASGILLTGATGLVGGSLLRRLLQESPERPVYALVRNLAAGPPCPGARLIQGDITQPRLGMAKEIYAGLCGSLGTIVHCAAATRFTLPLAEARQVNVRGTANVLELAHQTSQFEVLLHVSSTFIAGRRGGTLRETPLWDPAGWFSSYEQSKFEAEQLIQEQGAGLPWVIARLSTLAGHSKTGRVSQVNYFHQLLRLIPRNLFPVIPGVADAPVDLVADDWVADALMGILRTVPPAGSVLHLCAGPTQSVPAQEILERAFHLHQRQEMKMPKFVKLAEFQAFVAALRGPSAETLRVIAQFLILCLPHLELRQQFLNTKASALLAPLGIVPVRTRDFLPLVMRACIL